MARAFRRGPRSRLLRLVLLIIIFCLSLDLLSCRHSLVDPETSLVRANVRLFDRPRIFISSTHWNNEAILRGHWNNAILDLVQYFGAKNIYISVYESGSWDNSKDALRSLDRELDRLGVARTIELDETTHEDEINRVPTQTGWIETPRGKKELRRIPYLSRLRNLSLQPLERLGNIGVTFDKVLFLNDVVFETKDVIELLNTNNGDYAAACSMDFAKPPQYYDTFALRDSRGDEPIMQTWPYFRSLESRQALMNGQPIPVSSCWNGMIFMDARPFLNTTSPLRFRGISDSLAAYHVEASECCLIHADNPLSLTKGIFVNPAVRVGYNADAYNAVHGSSSWISLWDIFRGTWENRFKRLLTTPWFKTRAILSKVVAWEKSPHTSVEPGLFCLINEMQVLVSNGWAHV